MNQRVLVTGAAGFIGMHASRALLEAGIEVGVDNLDPYYDVRLKEARLETLASQPRFRFERVDLADAGQVQRVFDGGDFAGVVHLAAQAGVRHSLTHPEAYYRNNVVAFGHLLEACRKARVAHLVYASSSSVYGANHVLPFSEDQPVDHPVSLYAATKKSTNWPRTSTATCTGFLRRGCAFHRLRALGRPDMAAMLFTKAILAGEPIKVFNHGRMRRDFTYIDDIVQGLIRVLELPPRHGTAAPHAVYNIGNHEAVALDVFIATLEDLLGVRAHKEYLPMQPGDVEATYASVEALRNLTALHRRRRSPWASRGSSTGTEPTTALDPVVPAQAGTQRLSWSRMLRSAPLKPIPTR